MNKRKFWFFGAMTVTLCVLILLVTGSSLLTTALDNNNSIPLGTFITWAGMISLPLMIYWGAQEFRKPTNKFYTVLSILLKVILILAILWVPISYLLAGNISFSFSEKENFRGSQLAMKWFWYLSYGIGIVTLLIILSYWISLLFKKNKTGTSLR